jgi:hypothetical protein
MPAYETFSEEPEQEPVHRYREEAPPRRQARRPEPYLADPPAYQRRDPYHMAAEVEEVADEPPPQARPDFGYRREPQFDDADEFRREEFRQDDRNYATEREYAAERDYAAAEPRMQEPYFEHGTAMTHQDDDFYDDPPRARSRGGLITAVTLIGCAMIGTAGAYGYRTFYVAPNGRVPPVITAETTPNKVVSAGDVQTSKIIQDRVGDPSATERVVSREEQPVIIPPASGPPRVVLPAPGTPSPSQSVFPPPPSPGLPSVAGRQPNVPSTGAGGPSTSTSTAVPRRVRTVTIRPDGTDADTGRPVGGTQGAPAAARPAAKAAPAGRKTGPLPLEPDASAEARPAPTPRERVAAVPPTTQSLTPPAPRAAPASSASSGYLVQVSSQRSEAEAQASFRALQGKYPDQLSGHTVVVKRVDLGDKGVYYRALVGPFASSGEATQFCTEFRAAGGQCLIPRN